MQLRFLSGRMTSEVQRRQTRNRAVLKTFRTSVNVRRHLMSDFNVTDQAVTKLKEYMQANNIESALRVAMMQGG